MAIKKVVTQFLVDANLTIQTNCLVTANSLEEAVAKARELTVQDFVEILGDHNDSSLEINGVFKS